MKLLICFFLIFSFACSLYGELPVVDMAPLLNQHNFTSDEIFKARMDINYACRRWGFFQVINHGVSDELITELKNQMRIFFTSPSEIKESVRRKPNNSRGYANDELTKQLVDAKEVFDAGRSELYSNLSKIGLENQLLDGLNYWPDVERLPSFRRTVEEYFTACERLSLAIFHAMLSTLECGSADLVTQSLAQHTSFVRLNYYPIVATNACLSKNNNNNNNNNNNSSSSANTSESGNNHGDSSTSSSSSNQCSSVSGDVDGISSQSHKSFGVSRHTDSGVLTVLLQDEQSGLEVYSGSKEDHGDGEWLPVVPLEGALTINTGDMLQVWSNDVFKAAEHRVRASQRAVRYSSPFFYNPAYDTIVQPLLCEEGNTGGDADLTKKAKYAPIRWGDFRSKRFLGDYADIGKEIQIEDFRIHS